MNSASKNPVNNIKVNEKKWGRAVVNVGWTLVPNILLEKQSTLGISPIQLNIILIILKHWWHADDLPYPEMNTIAKSINVSRSTVQRNIRSLEQTGFITRIERKLANGGNTSNKYDISKLIKILKPYADDELIRREEAKKEKQKRLTARGNNPKLKVVQ